MEIVVIYSPCRNKEEAQFISNKLVNSGLVACSNSFPISSCYIFNDKMTQDNEYVLFCKLLSKNEKEVREMIKEMHSYKVPCVLSWKVNCDKEYFEWLSGK